jgi:hypothetical protein
LLLVWGVPVMNYNTQRDFIPTQPVPFSHKHHVSGLGLDCRYCHTTVEISQNAGLPTTEICMTCHSQVWTNAAVLAPVRKSFADGRPLRWTEVYTPPGYVYFDHSIHVAKGVGCTECHGPIGDMPITRKASDLYMRWCLDCHRDPAPHLRQTAILRHIRARLARFGAPLAPPPHRLLDHGRADGADGDLRAQRCRPRFRRRIDPRLTFDTVSALFLLRGGDFGCRIVNSSDHFDPPCL